MNFYVAMRWQTRGEVRYRIRSQDDESLEYIACESELGRKHRQHDVPPARSRATLTIKEGLADLELVLAHSLWPKWPREKRRER